MTTTPHGSSLFGARQGMRSKPRVVTDIPGGGLSACAPLVLTANDYVHRWSADEQALSDGDPVTTLVDSGSAANNLNCVSVVPGEQPIYTEGLFNCRAGVHFDRFQSHNGLASVSDVTIYPGKRGTIVWVGTILESFSFGVKIMYSVSNNDDQLLFYRSDQANRPVATSNDLDAQLPLETPPPDQIPQDVPQLCVMMRDSDTSIRFRRNGVERTGATCSDYPVNVGTFTCGFATGPGSSLAINHDLAMILVYDRVLSAGELTTLEAEITAAYL